MTFKAKVLQLIYPPTCPYCGDVLSPGEQGCCGECKKMLSYVEPPVCEKCGAELMDSNERMCRRCKSGSRSFDKGFPVLNYESPAKEGVLALKYKHRKEYAAYFATEILKKHGRDFCALAPEALVPVPVHRKKYKRRGYNQAELLAVELSRVLHVPVENDLIIRAVNTPPQKRYSPEIRERNMKTAFQIGEKSVNYRSVLLVDDIYTTGSTIEACTRLLKQRGVERVYYTSICIGKGY